MKKVVVALVLVLAGTLGLAGVATGSAEAKGAGRVILNAPSVQQAGKLVVLHGRVVGKATRVRVERKAGGRWVLVRRVAVRHGRFSVSTRQPAGRTSYRAVALGRYSAARVVQVVQSSSDGCGIQPVKPDGSLWSCTLDEEFNGTALNRSLWMPQTDYAEGTQAAHACYLDDPSVVNESGGSLNLTVRKVATPVSCSFAGMSGPTNYVGGSVSTYRLFSQQYGRFEARIKTAATTAPGLHEAFWLWPDDRVASTTLWPNAGEIDVSETYSRYPNLSIPFLHYSADVYGNLLGTNTAWNCTAYRGQWNTYTLTWTPTRLEIKVNGRTCLVNTSGDLAFRKPYIAAFTAGLGAAGNVFDGRAPMPATTSVDYFRVWK